MFNLPFQNFLDPQETIVVGVSGGPDSMCLLFLIIEYIAKTQSSGNQTKIVVCTCNHQQRLTAESEVLFVQKYCSKQTVDNLTCVVKTLDRNVSSAESSLRKRRHQQFVDVAKAVGADKIFLGHNLTDRFETMLLHMCRGCASQGLLALPQTDQHFLDKRKTIVRPLIGRAKDAIQAFCDSKAIPYILDESNMDPTVSKRNALRNTIIPGIIALSHQNKQGNPIFWKSFAHLCQDLEAHNAHTSQGCTLEPLSLQPSREAEFGYLITDKISADSLSATLRHQNIYYGLTNKILTELVDFFTTARSGYKYRNATYFFVCHGKKYIIKAKKHFRINTQAGQSIDVNSRYPKPEDRYKNKPLNKYLITQKVPLFMRQFVRVSEKSSMIVDVCW